MGSDFEEMVKTNPLALKAMSSGSTFKFMLFLDHFWTRTADLTCKTFLKDIKENRPDLIIAGTLSEYVGWYTSFHIGVPAVQLKIEIMVNDPLRAPWGFPTLPFGSHLPILRCMLFGLYKGWMAHDRAMLKYGGKEICSFTTAYRCSDEAFDPTQPVLVLISPKYEDAIFPYAHKNYRFVGASVIEKNVQETNINFGNTAEQQMIKQFIAEDQKPVYMGWGSMICKNPEYMTEIAVHALYLTNQRGLVLGGCAGLKPEMLDKVKNPKLRDTLKSYAAEKILFVKFCPHELVLPHVSCAVHHGGAGTTNASLRSGAPTIVTPIFWDQYDYAHLIKTKDVGVGFSKNFQKINVRELSDAIQLCISDVGIQKRAKAFSEELHNDACGVKNVIKYIEEFWQKEVVSGNWHNECNVEYKKMMAQKQERQTIYLSVGAITFAYALLFLAQQVNS